MSDPQSTFRIRVRVPRRVKLLPGRTLDREAFYSWIWESFSASGLLGVHEGTLLSETAAELGLETESWTIDSGEAPRERDWVADQELVDTDVYFATPEGARAAAAQLSTLGLDVGPAEEQKPQDWDAEWKASFTGAQVPPFWSVLPPWVRPQDVPGARAQDLPRRTGQQPDSVLLGKGWDVLLRVNPGAGFGTGTHETTQLCLEALGELALRRIARGGHLSQAFSTLDVLDFGSGSGILAFGAALLGAKVDAVEIDPLAIENATENARLNGIESRIEYSRALSSAAKPYPIVLANILKPVLLEFSRELVARLAPGGTLILSGLMQKDGDEVAEHYASLLGGVKPARRASGEWRALVWNLGS